MKVARPSPAAAFVLTLLLIFNPLFTGVSSAAQPPPASKLPWDNPKTQEKVKPKELEDKETKKDDPLGWCTKTKKNGDQETTATYADGTEVHYIPGKSWTIIIPGPKGKTKITYDMDKKTRTVEEPGEKPKVQDPAQDPAAKDWKEGKEKEAADAKKLAPCGGTCNPTPAPNANPPTPNPTQPKKGTWLFPSDSTRLVNVAFPAYSRAAPASREIPAAFAPSPILLAATAEREKAAAPETQERKQNLKIVIFGDPPPGLTMHFDNGPQTPQKEFTEIPGTPIPWDPKTDGDGPKTTRIPGPGPFETTIFIVPRGGINIGSDWAYAPVSDSFLEECGGDGDDADLQEAKRLLELAKKAKDGGPEYWRKRAQAEDGNAKRAEQDQRGRAKEAALERAKENRATADELERRGVPDKPDPKLPKAQRDDIDKQRADAIKKIEGEAAEHTRKASTR